MPFILKTLRSAITGKRPGAGHQYGEVYVNIADDQIGMIDENGLPQDLIGVRIFSDTGMYYEGDYVVFNGHLFKANNDIAPGAFNHTEWNRSGADLSITDYNVDSGYEKDDVVFFPAVDHCFHMALVDIPSGTVFDKDMWGPICDGNEMYEGVDFAGETVLTFELSIDYQGKKKLVPLIGQELNRTGPYEDLFTAWGTQFGQGNGSSTFNVPDMRGFSLRGVDASLGVDVDGASRYAIHGGGNTGATGGSYQDDQLKSHNHFWNLDDNTSGYGAQDDNDLQNGQRPTSFFGGNETRMKNISFFGYARY